MTHQYHDALDKYEARMRAEEAEREAELNNVVSADTAYNQDEVDLIAEKARQETLDILRWHNEPVEHPNRRSVDNIRLPKAGQYIVSKTWLERNCNSVDDLKPLTNNVKVDGVKTCPCGSGLYPSINGVACPACFADTGR